MDLKCGAVSGTDAEEQMKNVSKGVTYYTHGTVTIPFPEDDLCCMWCPLMGMELKANREYCKATGELLLAPREYVGSKCPMVFEMEENDG
jgi:hypothetical protein